MKRGLAITIICFSLIFVFSLSIVSAGFFSDIWSRITGAQVEENVTAESVSETPTPAFEPIPEEMTCEEYCKINTMPPVGCIIELRVSGTYPSCECEWICKEPITPKPQPEKQCEEGEIKNYICPGGTEVSWCRCENGMWVCAISPENACPREIEEVKECAARIEVSSNQEVYYLGDPFEIKVEIFDSTGRLTPNYPFYSELYDGVWHTPEQDRTNENGYVKHEGAIEEGSIPGWGKIKFKVYTDVADCPRVEDILEIELKKGERGEEVCGIGVCVPDEKEKEKGRGVLAAACFGCEKDEKCYPMGYRKEGNFCSEDYEFVGQLQDDVKCENSFECKSNFCINGQCISGNLIIRMINWFKRLVGVGPEPPAPEPSLEVCSDLLIEKNIGDYEYFESGYGEDKESQVQVYSKDGEQIGVVKCCMARYVAKEENEGGAIVCPFDNREDIENSLKWLLARGEISLSEYNGQNVIRGTDRVVAWTQNNYVISVGKGPHIGMPLPEEIVDEYLKKYPNDLEITEEISFVPPEKKLPDEKFLDEIKNLGTMTLIDFETLPDGTVLENGDKLTGKEWESLEVIFEFPSEDYLQVFGPKYPFNPLDKLSLSPGLGPFEAGGDTHDDLNIIFSESVKAVGIYLLDLGETDDRESITFLDENNNVIKKISPWPKSTFGNPAPGTFVGLIHEEGISKIEILENTQDGDDIAYDNLYFVK